MVQANLVIKQQKPLSWYVGSGVGFVGILILCFYVGRYLAVSDLQETKEQLMLSNQQLKSLQTEYDTAAKSLVLQKQTSQVDNQSNQALIESIKSLEADRKKLMEELKFYRKIMAPELDLQGLNIEELLLSPTEKPNQYHFSVTLIQAGKQNQFLKGRIDLKLQGTQQGKPTEFNFRELGAFKAKHFQFQFKYFQNLQGVINIPAGFKPKNIAMVARTTGLRKNQTATKQQAWQVEES